MSNYVYLLLDFERTRLEFFSELDKPWFGALTQRFYCESSTFYTYHSFGGKKKTLQLFTLKIYLLIKKLTVKIEKSPLVHSFPLRCYSTNAYVGAVSLCAKEMLETETKDLLELGRISCLLFSNNVTKFCSHSSPGIPPLLDISMRESRSGVWERGGGMLVIANFLRSPASSSGEVCRVYFCNGASSFFSLIFYLRLLGASCDKFIFAVAPLHERGAKLEFTWIADAVTDLEFRQKKTIRINAAFNCNEWFNARFVQIF